MTHPHATPAEVREHLDRFTGSGSLAHHLALSHGYEDRASLAERPLADLARWHEEKHPGAAPQARPELTGTEGLILCSFRPHPNGTQGSRGASRATGIGPATTARTLDGLGRKGLLEERQPGRWALTAAGRALLGRDAGSIISGAYWESTSYRGRDAGNGPQAPAWLGDQPLCPDCGDPMELRGHYGAPGKGQPANCPRGHAWALVDGLLWSPEAGAHILTPEEVR